jgi:hypothetical protein
MIAFLGFGFHPQNLELLEVPARHQFRDVNVLATIVGLHQANLAPLETAIKAGLKANDVSQVETHDMTASKMLKELRLKMNLALG